MRLTWAFLLAASFGLAGCDLPIAPSSGKNPAGGSGAPTLSDAERSEWAQVFKDLLATQQARQQVSTTSGTLIADNSAGILSNNGGSLIKSAPLIANNAGGLISNGSGNYHLAALKRSGQPQYVAMADGLHFYRLGNLAGGDTFVETFITRTPNASSSGFEIDEDAIVVHSRMIVTLPKLGDDPLSWFEETGTTHYAIEVLKSPVLSNYVEDVWISAPFGGKTQRYVSNARYALAGVPVTAEATHSAFAPFGGVDLPTSGEERIRIGEAMLDLSYQTVSGQGRGTGSWNAPGREAWPLTYTYDFDKNVAEMRLNLPEERRLILKIRPGMQVEEGQALDKEGTTLATLVKRADGAAVLKFSQGEERLLFE